MSELRRLIQAHLDEYGVTRSEFARRSGTKPQTVQNWWDKPTTLPSRRHLEGVAAVLRTPYLVVLTAALVDAGYLDSMDAGIAELAAAVDLADYGLAARHEDRPKG